MGIIISNYFQYIPKKSKIQAFFCDFRKKTKKMLR